MPEGPPRVLLPTDSASGSATGFPLTPPHEQPKANRGKSSRANLARVACDPCRKRKSKCDGQLPRCTLCLTSGRECRYEADPGKTRTESLKRKNEELQERLDVMERLIYALRSSPEPESAAILQRIKSMPPTHDPGHLLRYVEDAQLLVSLHQSRSPSDERETRSPEGPLQAGSVLAEL